MKLGCKKSALIAAVVAMLCSGTAFAQDNEKATITVLETSDVHGRLMNYDYAADKEEKAGLVKCATIVRQERAKDPDLLLLDCGDLTQGNMVSDFRVSGKAGIHPAVKALNCMKYDAWELGNHEFNFEFESLQNNIRNFRGVVLGANIYNGSGNRFVSPYFIRNIGGVKVAVFGMEAPHITVWEANPSHYNNDMKFTSIETEIGRVLDELEAQHPDVIIGLCHYGEFGEKGQKGMLELAQMYKDRVDAFLIGHAHSTLVKYVDDKGEICDASDGRALSAVLETGTNAANVGKLTLDLQKDADGNWQIVDRHIENISALDVEPDPELVACLADVHRESIAKANTEVGTVSEDFYKDPLWLPHIPYAVIQDGPLLDFVHKVMLDVTKADVSQAGIFSEQANLLAGAFKFKDGVKIYRYDNSLVKVKVSGAQLKAIMEKCAGDFFNQYKPGDVTISFNPALRLYEFDSFSGVDYKVDISKPQGQRIVDVMYRGKPLRDDEQLTLALNSYRFGNLVQRQLLKAEDKIYDSCDEEVSTIREMIINYVAAHKSIAPECDNNWKIIGFQADDAQKDLIYDMIRQGKILIPCDNSGRTTNVKAVNAPELRAQGVLPPLSK